MFEWDRQAIAWLNQFARQSWSVDQAIYILTTNSEFKGYVVAAVFLWLWFQKGGGRWLRRQQLLVVLAGAILSVLLGRLLQLNLPFVPRPKNDPQLDFILPFGVEPAALSGWSSFPSDHSILFFGVVAGLIGISRPMGLLVLVYISLVVGVGRMYIGYHYPSDIVMGGLLGAGVVLALQHSRRALQAAGTTLQWADRYRSVFYPVFFFLVYQLAILFVHLRDLAVFGGEAIQRLIQ